MKLKFLADMGISPRTVTRLSEQGYDAIHLIQEGLEKLEDRDILLKAEREKRIVLTIDLDFGYLLAVSGAKLPSVILFRKTMEELAELRQLLLAGNTTEAIALIDELEEMGRKAIIRNIESYLLVLLAHLIKYQAEPRMTNSWLASIVNAIVRIKKLNQRDRNSYYIKAADWDDYLEEAVELAILEAAREAFGGIYSVEQLSGKFDRDRVLTIALQLLELTYHNESRDLPRTTREFINNLGIL